MLATGSERRSQNLQEMLIAAELASLVDLVRRPGEAWLLLCGGPIIAASQLPGRAFIAGLDSARRTTGAWRGHLSAPPIQHSALDGLVLHHVRGSLHSLLHEWLPCIRPGGRLVLIDGCTVRRPGRQRRLVLAQLRRWERERALRRTGGMIFGPADSGVMRKDLDQLPSWQRHWLAVRAASLRVDFVYGEQDGAIAPLQRLKTRRVAVPLHGVSGV